MHRSDSIKQLVACAAMCFAAQALNAAPTFETQPQGGLVAQTGDIAFSFTIRAEFEATWEFEGDTPQTALLASGRSIEQSRDNGVLTVKYTALQVGAEQNTRPTFRIRVTDSTGTTLSDPFTAVVVSRFFTRGSSDLGNGYYQNNTLGLLYAGNPPYVYNDDGLGWFALSDSSNINAWMYLLGTPLEWLYYSPLTYPWLYSTGEDSWVYFVTIDGVRWFYVNSTDEWVAAP